MLTGTTVVAKLKENVQCGVVLIQTDKDKNERNQRELTRDFKIIMFSGTTKRQAKTIWHDTVLRSFSKKDR